ncbi:hypothetical protein QTP70_011356 [Hemibagrus guttatus]|uniref:Uncharacterized protein n=1 Tax=Hemibagrus guttatus TaxID=175788 RepID=A0AAE0R8Y7_9TELE|nr:hypothetical protein QTP70_011356 [Hemibagrus guttatus]KAK3567083.1 hypothetical protein QTP86_009787 [Hemibagrus guttatus]
MSRGGHFAIPVHKAVLRLRVLRPPESSVPGEAFIYPALINSGAAVNLIDGLLVEGVSQGSGGQALPDFLY